MLNICIDLTGEGSNLQKADRWLKTQGFLGYCSFIDDKRLSETQLRIESCIQHPMRWFQEVLGIDLAQCSDEYDVELSYQTLDPDKKLRESFIAVQGTVLLDM